MKKKLTNGEKRECRLRYLFRQWKRCGKIPKGSPLCNWRDKLNRLVTLKESKPRKKKKKKPQQRPVAKAFRRKARKQLRAKFTRAIQIAKKARRERRKAYEQKKHDRFEENKEKRLPSDEDSRQILNVREKLPTPKE